MVIGAGLKERIVVVNLDVSDLEYFWTNKNTYNDNDYGRNGGLDGREYKVVTYWKTLFNEICVAMKYDGRVRAFSLWYPATSLYDLIADGNYRQTNIGRSQWKQLIHGSTLITA